MGLYSPLAKYIALEPEEPNAYFRMGVMLVMKNDYRKARELFLKTVTLNPGNSEALLYLAKLHLLNGNKAAAVNNLKQILKIGESPEAEELLRQIKP